MREGGREREKRKKILNHTKNMQCFPNPSDAQTTDSLNPPAGRVNFPLVKSIKHHLSQFFSKNHNYSMETRQQFSAQFYEQKQ